MKAPRSVRVLGACGLSAAVLTMLAGFLHLPEGLGVAGLIMVLGNLYSIVRG